MFLISFTVAGSDEVMSFKAAKLDVSGSNDLTTTITQQVPSKCALCSTPTHPPFPSVETLTAPAVCALVARQHRDWNRGHRGSAHYAVQRS